VVRRCSFEDEMSFVRLTTLLSPMALENVVPGVETLHDASGIR
jgi:hypothetical protein